MQKFGRYMYVANSKVHCGAVSVKVFDCLSHIRYIGEVVPSHRIGRNLSPIVTDIEIYHQYSFLWTEGTVLLPLVVTF